MLFVTYKYSFGRQKATHIHNLSHAHKNGPIITAYAFGIGTHASTLGHIYNTHTQISKHKQILTFTVTRANVQTFKNTYRTTQNTHTQISKHKQILTFTVTRANVQTHIQNHTKHTHTCTMTAMSSLMANWNAAASLVVQLRSSVMHNGCAQCVCVCVCKSVCVCLCVCVCVCVCRKSTRLSTTVLQQERQQR